MALKVNLLICPLKMYSKHELARIDFYAIRDELHHVPFRGLQHWAIQAGDHIFEVTSNGCADGKPKYRMIKVTGVGGWWDDHAYNKNLVVDRFMGFTGYTVNEIHELSEWIWKVIMKQQYFFFTTNCQTFSAILRNLIVDNTGLQPEVRAQLDSMPRPLNPLMLIMESANRIRQLAAASGRLALRPFREERPKGQSPSPPRLPVRPSQNWLLALRKGGRNMEVDSDEALYKLLQEVRKQQRQERCGTAKRDLTRKPHGDSQPSP